MPKAFLWEVVAVSCQCPPTAGIEAVRGFRECDNKIRIAAASLGSDLPVVEWPSNGDLAYAIVSLTEFAAFAKRKGWSLPPRFPVDPVPSSAESAAPAATPRVSGPEWKHWSNMPSVHLAQAVALSLDIEPRSISVEEINSPSDAEWRGRLMVANAGWADGILPRAKGHLSDESNSPYRYVKLPEFATWSQSLPHPWELPKEFPREKKPNRPQDPVASQTSKPVQSGEPAQAISPTDTQDSADAMGRKERETLLSIIGALVGEDGLAHPWTEAQKIEGRLVKMDLSAPKARTISGYLNEAKQTIDSRKK